MKKTNIILLVLLVATIGFFFYAWNASKQPRPAASETSSAIIPPNAQNTNRTQTKTNDEGGVQVTVQPPVFSADSTTWDFAVELNTHSGDLGEDMARVSSLLGDDGAKYTPISWEGDLPGGHHRGGILKFQPISPLPTALTLIIQDIGGVPERKFVWQMKTAEGESHLTMDSP